MSDKKLQLAGEIVKGIDNGDNTVSLAGGSYVYTKTVTIANGATKSAELDCGNGTLVGFVTDSGLNNTAMTFEGGVVAGATVGLNNMYGALSLTVAASKAYAIDPADFFPFRYVKFVGGTAETDATTITAIIRVM